MGIARRIIRIFDRPGGRQILAFAATQYSRRVARMPVSIAYDGHWIRQWDGGALVDEGVFHYYAETLRKTLQEWLSYQEQTRQYYFWKYTPREGDTIVDVGAGIGTDVVAFSRAVGSTGRVLAIEAHPDTYARLEKTCRLHHLNNVTLVNAAVVGTPKSVYISSGADHLSNRTTEDVTETAVQGQTLDGLCSAHGIDTAAFVKMNIEGAEREAIHGASRIASRTGVFCICCHDFLAERGGAESCKTSAIVEHWLRDHGFATFTRDLHPLCYVRDHIHGVR
jgi:FkbM family methyltransferase